MTVAVVLETTTATSVTGMVNTVELSEVSFTVKSPVPFEIGSLKTATRLVAMATPVALFAGVSELIVGAVVSPGR